VTGSERDPDAERVRRRLRDLAAFGTDAAYTVTTDWSSQRWHTGFPTCSPGSALHLAPGDLDRMDNDEDSVPVEVPDLRRWCSGDSTTSRSRSRRLS
jgi:hypothetical protein